MPEAVVEPEAKTVYKEVPYLQGEKISVSDDVYGMTIAANITGNVRPLEYIFRLRQCVFVFIIQLCIAVFFAVNAIVHPDYPTELFSWRQCIIRIIAGTLLQIQLNQELKGGLQ